MLRFRKKTESVAKSCYQFHLTYGFWGTPNIELKMNFDGYPGAENVRIRHDKSGNRNNEIREPASDRPILCYGGSHTWGAGVAQESRYTEKLADLSGRSVINVGHCSLGLDQICLAIIKDSQQYNPEMIVIEQYPWAVHRILNNYVNGYVKPYFFLDGAQNLKLHKVSNLAKFQLIRKTIGSYYAFRKEFREFRSGLDIKDNYDPRSDPIFLLWKMGQYDAMYALLENILIVIRDYCAENNIKLIFGLGAIHQQFLPPSLSELIDYELPAKRLKTILEKLRIEYADASHSMLQAHSVDSPVIFFDGHINKKGHAKFGEILYSEICSRGWFQS